MKSMVGLALAVLALAAVFTPLALSADNGARIGQVAPEITGGPWINSAPLTMSALRGRVVFVEFWTFG